MTTDLRRTGFAPAGFFMELPELLRLPTFWFAGEPAVFRLAVEFAASVDDSGPFVVTTPDPGATRTTLMMRKPSASLSHTTFSRIVLPPPAAVVCELDVASSCAADADMLLSRRWRGVSSSGPAESSSARVE